MRHILPRSCGHMQPSMVVPTISVAPHARSLGLFFPQRKRRVLRFSLVFGTERCHCSCLVQYTKSYLRADKDEAFSADVDEVLKYAKEYQDQIYAFTVGSEGLYRDEQKPGSGYKADYILDKINSFKKSLETAGIQKKVGTADSWNKYQDGTADPLIQGGVDLL